jgi:VRR-NUC domain
MSRQQVMSAEKGKKMLYRQVKECDFQQQVIEAAHLLGWKAYHTYDSRKCTSNGYADLTLVHPSGHGFIMAELKKERGVVSPEQAVWLAALQANQVECYVWRPSQIDEIIARLQRGRR